MIDPAAVGAALAGAGLETFAAGLPGGYDERLRAHGDHPRWSGALDALPSIAPAHLQLDRDTVTVGTGDECDAATRATLAGALAALHPWRKGPFDLFGVLVDSEWRSDLKWARLAGHLQPLAGRRILDVGGGNGYYLWRMLGAGARLVVNVDPTVLYVMQFLALQRYIRAGNAFTLPLRAEQLPRTGGFDTVFSMGVLYHRRHGAAHLAELYDLLRPGGELVLETLVLDGDEQAVLEPGGRYARMRNVWAIPGTGALARQVEDAGFAGVRIIDRTVTTPFEQRTTPWMRFESLADSLDPEDPSKTVEGHPAPVRAILVASRPS